MLWSPGVPATAPVVLAVMVALLVGARCRRPSLPAAHVLLVGRLLRLRGPIPTVTPAGPVLLRRLLLLLLPGDSHTSNLFKETFTKVFNQHGYFMLLSEEDMKRPWKKKYLKFKTSLNLLKQLKYFTFG